MKFYEFGEQCKLAILLLPGTCCHWKKNFDQVIPLLEPDFHVICASYNGFDETEQTTFPDMLTETSKIEQYIQKNCGGCICAAYGCSLGGSFIGLLIQRHNIHIDHGVLRSSDLDQETGPGVLFRAWFFSRSLHEVFQKGDLPGWIKRHTERHPNREYMDRTLTLFGIADKSMSFVSRQSLRNQFYSDLITPLEIGISVSGTTVHCFYAKKMGKQYRSRYERHFRKGIAAVRSVVMAPVKQAWGS